MCIALEVTVGYAVLGVPLLPLVRRKRFGYLLIESPVQGVTAQAGV